MAKIAVLAVSLLCCSFHYSPAAEARSRAYRDRIQPHWFAEGTRFWYRVDIARNQYEFVLVDASRGTRQAAFDHERLATALRDAGITNALATRLPLQDLEFEPAGGGIRFRAGEKNWRCDLKNYSLAEEAGSARATGSSALDPVAGPHASRRTGEETSLSFVNRTGAEVKLFWLDPDGRRQSYGKLAPGESRDQHTFAGHVWLVTDTDDKSLAVFEAQESGGEAVIK